MRVGKANRKRLVTFEMTLSVEDQVSVEETQSLFIDKWYLEMTKRR